MIRSLVRNVLLASMAISGWQAAAQCPAGYTSVSKNGFAIGFETNTVTNPAWALGPFDVTDNQQGAILASANSTSPFLINIGQVLTLNFGELVTPGSTVTLSLGHNNSTANGGSRMKIETTADGSTYTVLGYYSNTSANTSDLFRGTYGNQVPQFFNFNAPSGGVRKIRFTLEAGVTYVEGVRYQSVCRPTASLTCGSGFQPAASITSTGTSAVENANGALTLDYFRFSEGYPTGYVLPNSATARADTKIAGLNGNGRGVLVADLGQVVTAGNYIVLNMAGYTGSVNGIPTSSQKGRQVEVTISNDGTNFTSITGGTMGNYLNPTNAQNYFDDNRFNTYYLEIPSSGVRFVRIRDLGSDGDGGSNTTDVITGPDLYVDFVGYSCAPSLFDFGDLPDGSASNSATDFSTTIANNGPRHERTYRGFAFTKIAENTSQSGSYFDVCTASPSFCSKEYDITFSRTRSQLFLNTVGALGTEPTTEGAEEGLDVGTISPTATSYSLSTAKLSGSNTTSLTANIYAFLDLNQNGVFEASEAVTTTFANGASTAAGALTWNNLPALTENSEMALRIRITTATLTDDVATATVDERSLGLAPDGEVEDYLIPVTTVSAACFPCINSAFAVSGSPSDFYKIDIRTGVRTLVKAGVTGSNNYTITALGFNEATGEFWGVARGTNKMVKITSAGLVTYEDFTNLPANKNWEAGDIANGMFYLHSGAAGDDLLYIVDLTTKAVTTKALKKGGNTFIAEDLANGGRIRDMAFNPVDGKIYYAGLVDYSNGFANKLFRIDPSTGIVDELNYFTFKNEVFGQHYFDNLGRFYAISEGSWVNNALSSTGAGDLYRMDNVSTLTSTGGFSFALTTGGVANQITGGDGARCVSAPLTNQIRYEPEHYAIVNGKKEVSLTFDLTTPKATNLTKNSMKVTATLAKTFTGTTILERGFYYMSTELMNATAAYPYDINTQYPGRDNPNATKVPATASRNSATSPGITGNEFEADLTGLDPGKSYMITAYALVADVNGNTWYITSFYTVPRIGSPGGYAPARYYLPSIDADIGSTGPTFATTIARDYSERYSVQVNGNATMAANSLVLDAPLLKAADVDNDPSTGNSSSSDLILPKGAKVLKAYLYWMARTWKHNYPASPWVGSGEQTIYKADEYTGPSSKFQATAPPADPSAAKALIKGPNGSYTQVIPQAADLNYVSDGARNYWQGLADVTSIVNQRGIGRVIAPENNVQRRAWTYTVSVPFLDQAPPELAGKSPSMAGWGMIVVYQVASEPPRQIKLYDGYFIIVPGVDYSTSLTGLITPTFGKLNSTFGMLSLYGDPGGALNKGLKGDYIEISTEKTSPVKITDAENPDDPAGTDPFNSTISFKGKNVLTRNPNSGFTHAYSATNGDNVYTAPDPPSPGFFIDNSFLSKYIPPTSYTTHRSNDLYRGKNKSVGFDADVFDISNYLVPSISSVNFKFGTNGDVYQSGAAFIAVELKAPKITGKKGLVDLNGGEVEVNDILEYTLSVQNTGTDDGVNTSVIDSLPSSVNLIPNSLRLTRGFDATQNDVTWANGVAVTDDVDADRAYVAAESSFEVSVPGETDPRKYSVETTETITGVGTVVLNADGTSSFTPDPNYTGDAPKIRYIPGNSIVWFVGDDSDPNAAFRLQRDSIEGYQTLKYRVIVNSSAFGQPIINSFTTNTTGTTLGFENSDSGIADETPTPTDVDLDGEFTLPIYPDVNATYVGAPLKGSVATNEGLELFYKPPVADPTNPTGSKLTFKSDGTYTFTATKPGIYYFDVPACPDSVATKCPINKLAITVTDPYDKLDEPVANTDIAVTRKEEPVTLKTLVNDQETFLGGALNPASVKVLTPADSIPGTLTVNPQTGDITFTPDPGFTGYAIYEYEVCDTSTPAPICTKARQEIQVLSDLAPNITAAADDYSQGFQGVAQNGNLLLNDTDPESDVQTVTPQNLTLPEGTLVINSDGSYTFTPVADFKGPLNVPYTICDDATPPACTKATLYLLVVDPVNPFDDVESTPANTPFNGSVKTNDQVFPGTTYGTPTADANNPAGATLTLNSDGTYTFTAPTFGVYVYTVPVCGAGQTTNCDTETLTINVLDVKDDVNAGLTNVPLSGDLSPNDDTPAGTTYGTPVASDNNPAEATLTINPDGSYNFTAPQSGVYVYEVPVCQAGQTTNCETQLLTITIIGTNPDVNATYSNVPVEGSVVTNDDAPVGTTYGTPAAEANNPGPSTITMNPDGTYVFTAANPGVYLFDVPLCQPGQTTNCPTEKLKITVIDPAAANNVPVANTDLAVTKINTPVTLETLANDLPGGAAALNPASVNVTTQPANGTVSVDAVTGKITYTPNTDFTGVDEYKYTVCDTATPANCTTATQKVTILPADAANTTFASDDYNYTNSLTPATGSVLTNDPDAEGDNQTVTAQDVTLPEGIFILNADGTYVFTPAAGFNGPVNIVYQVCDDGTPKACANATLYLLVSPANADPDVNATYTNVPVDGSVETNDEMPSGTTYGTPTLDGSPTGSSPTITMNADGSYSFTGDKPGIYVYDVPVCLPGQTSNCPIEKLTITVLDLNGNNPPVANTDLASTEAATAVTLNTLANDKPGTIDLSLNPASVNVTAQPANGTVSVNSTTGAITYTPAAGFTGIDYYTYQVCDTGSPVQCTTAIQEIIVTAPTSANTTTAADDFNSTHGKVPATGNLLTNDIDAQGDDQTATPQQLTLPEGEFTLLADGSYTFTPADGFTGPVAIPYTICDDNASSACSSATLYILVRPNKAPTAYPNAYTTPEDTPVSGNMLTDFSATGGKDSDPDKDPLSVTSFTVGGATYQVSVGGTTATIPNVGSLLVNSDGTFTFTPVLNYNGPVPQTTYTISDGNGGTASSTLDINVTPVNDAPIAYPNAYTSSEEVAVSGSVLNDLSSANAKDSDPENDVLTVTGFTVNGQNYAAGATATLTGVGTLKVNADGTFTFTPELNFNGSVPQTTYSISDGKGGTASSTLDITITPVNDLPVAQDDSATTPQGIAVGGTVIANDSDPDNDPLNVTALTVGSVSYQPGSTVVIDGVGELVLKADGSYTFKPAPAFIDEVTVPYTICDNATPAGCASAVLRILVTPSDTDPDVNATFAGVSVKGDVSTNDGVSFEAVYGTPVPGSKPDGAIATITMNPDGTYVFKGNKPGVYEYDVPVCPSGQTTGCPSEKLTIHVLEKTAEANNPVANVDIAYTTPSTAVTLKTLANDGPGTLGANLDPATVQVTTQPANGTVTVNPVTGDITYTPKAGFLGVDVYKYTVCDDKSPAKCVTSSQEITVTDSKLFNLTQAADDYASTLEGASVSGNVLTNDTDPEGNASTVTAQNVSLPEGDFVLSSDGSYTFKPAVGFSGPVNVPYSKCDNGTPQACADATVYILVKPFEPQPDVNATFVGTPIKGSIITNDQVFSGAEYALESPDPNNPTGADIQINADGTYTFTADKPGVYVYVCLICQKNQSSSGRLSAPFRMRLPYRMMEDLPCKRVTLTITVLDPQATNNPPIANTDIASTLEATPVVLKTLSNDFAGSIGVNLVPSTVAIETQPTNGTVSVNAQTGDVTYTPAAGFTGVDQYTYKVCDSQNPSKCTTATQKITVLDPATPNTTLAADDFNFVRGPVPVTGNVLTNDTDPQGQSQTAVPQNLTLPQGTFVLNANGTYTFTAAPGFEGQVEIPYTKCDNGSPQACANATLYILVSPASIDAVNNDFTATPVNGYTGGVAGNIYPNDLVNGQQLQAAEVTLTLLNNGGVTGLTISSTGALTVPAGTPAGTYTATYKICQVLIPALCDEATVVFVVAPPVILATTDDLTDTPISNEKGGVAGNIFPNDKLNNTTIDGAIKSDVTITLLDDGGLTGVTIADDGTVSVPAGTTPGTYTLHYKICDNLNPTNCSEADVIILIEQTELVIPDGISPNGDGLNEVFYIEGLSGYPDNQILIFNRWGNKVFESKQYKNNWDGTSSNSLTVGSGNRLPAGTYFYVLDLGTGKRLTGYIYIAY